MTLGFERALKVMAWSTSSNHLSRHEFFCSPGTVSEASLLTREAASQPTARGYLGQEVKNRRTSAEG